MIVVTIVDVNWDSGQTANFNGSAMIQFYELQDAQNYAIEQSKDKTVPGMILSVLVTVWDGTTLTWYKNGSVVD